MIGWLYEPSEDGNVREFVKFEREGRSASLSERSATGEICKSCGAAINYGKFSVQDFCSYCKAGDAANTHVTAKSVKNFKSRFGIFISVASLLIFIVGVFFLVFIPLFGFEFLRDYSGHLAVMCAISFFTFFFGLLFWHSALSAFNVRALVKERGKQGVLFGKVVFETEQNESLTLDVPTDKYPMVLEGDVGILRYKLSEKEARSFVDFKSDGKSVLFTYTTETANCKGCGAAISVKKQKFNTKLICEYCGKMV
ncbi:MAG: hypothetical protein FWH14_03465 [Oscillospiraceae bacterium]|nr:hypothetical protein [Oscillospiraceae bacterium]